jgi:hypothetical protein
MSKFTYDCTSQEINEIRSKLSYTKPPMKGFYDELITLKSKLEKFYDDDIFYVGYGLNDAPFFGWEGKKLEDMWRIQNDINTKFKELYAIVLSATNTEIE